MIFDFHVHYYPDTLAGRALSLAASNPDIHAFTDGTYSGLLGSMRESGIDFALNLPLSSTADNVKGLNRWAALHNQAPVFSLGSIHPATENPSAVIAGLKEMGLKGIKLHPEYQDFSPLEERVRPIWDACEEHGFFVLTHAGADVNFPPPPKSRPRDFARLIDRHPQLKLVLAHMGSWGLWDESESELLGRNLYLDLAYVTDFLPAERLTKMIRSHGADKILFGTDSPWRSQSAAIAAVRALPLGEDEKELIFHKNAFKLLGLS
ncbi:MAG: hypothetical protein A2X49_06165 [Lentisphaerae bacterium GWF2_52_8]|nr:MAG: hypothetical protein A2X49_06165 [Lentisphaerae bacterium GWF2_52_8]